MKIHFATAVLDACVLYPAPLRDLLMHLALNGLFRARWTEKIQNEWMSNLLTNRPDLEVGKLRKTCDLMNRAIPDANVTNYERAIEILQLPDPNDRHVLAAAIKGGADSIVTFNLKDFPTAQVATYKVKIFHPDAFVVYLAQQDLARVCEAAKRQREMLKNPARSVDEYLETIRLQRLPLAVEILEKHKGLL